MRESVLKQNVWEDKNFLSEGSWLAWDETSNKAAGFVVSKVWQDQVPGIDFNKETGWIQALLVGGGYHRRGIGSKLLAMAEAALQDKGVRTVELGNDFHYRIFPGIPDSFIEVKQWFEKKGYISKEVSYDLWRWYEDDSIVSLPQFEGVTFRTALPNEAERVIAFMRRCFPGRWEYQTIQYWQKGGTGREIVIAEKDGEMIGFCRINDSHSPLLAQNVYWAPLFQTELGGVGPLGIDERLRGYGYGLAVVEAGVYFLHQRGIRQIVIDTTGFVDFYGKLGYEVWKSYRRFAKSI
jgi:GNAT superfamily N-acetyltransferase